MKIGIIGAGFTGLSAAYSLAKQGHKVIVLEKEPSPGGLAAGFKTKSWQWPLEKYYHHVFTSDQAVLNLANEVKHQINFLRPKTSTFIKEDIYQLDSPLSLLSFPKLSIKDRLRMGVVLAYLRLTPFWQPLEKITSHAFIKKYMGSEAWKVIWQPLFKGKFGRHSHKIPASWFWARIKKRSLSLGYPKGGFESLAKSIEKSIKQRGGKIIYQTNVLKVVPDKSQLLIKTNKNNVLVDKVICTLPTPLFLKITKGLPKSYLQKISRLKGMGAISLILSLKERFLKDETYWLNINESGFPFLAIVEHTNFIARKNYAGQSLLYIGNYLMPNHKFFKYTQKDLVDEFMPYLQKINRSFNKKLISNAWAFKTPFAQPIPSLNFSPKIIGFRTPVQGLFLANIQQVYPWDRGINYAVDLGQKVAQEVLRTESL